MMRHPGLLTLHYLQGKRARYVAPIRLYVFISFLSFLLLALLPEQSWVSINVDGADSSATVQSVPDDGDDSEEDDSPNEASAMDRWIKDSVQLYLDDPDRTHAYFLQRLPWIYFLIMPIFATVLQIFYRKRESYYVPHLIFTLHIYAAGFVLYTLGKVTSVASTIDEVMNLAMIGILCYMFLALRRVYGEGFLRTILKQTCLMFVHGICALISMGLLFVYTVLMI